MSRATLRPVDLARIAGVSAQQIRNYADDGILPPAERTPAGYRTFDSRHRDAMLTYRTLARGYGWDVARTVMRSVHAGDLPAALALVDARHAALHEQRLTLQTASTALEAVAAAGPGMADAPRTDLRIGEAARLLGVRTSALRVWEEAGLVLPRREPVSGYRRYGPDEVRDARMVQILRQGRYGLPQIRAVLDGLRRTGDTGALRAAFAERQAVHTATALAMLEGSGLLHHYLTEHVRG
ncbi:MerR family transcriptional regulator [Spirillospora sp. NPDC047279]|uniref:MerR family transcriptional regulator n=1 Tax=Spirillospora sp. NPDC047279 TaxID=3155478 RepID=UPI0033E9A52E